MGRLKSKSLMALGLRSIKELVPFRGGYRHRKVRTHDNGELYFVCYSKDLKQQFEVSVDHGGLFEMGLHRDEEQRGKIVAHGLRIEVEA